MDYNEKVETKDITGKGENGKSIFLIISCTMLLTATFCMLIMMTGTRTVLQYAIGLPLAFALPNLIRSGSKKGAIAFSVVTAVAAAVTIIIWHSEIIDGICLLVNNLYVASEKSQAYLYDKFEIARDPGSYILCMRYAALWMGTAAGAILSFIPMRIMRWISCLICIADLISLAFFGLLPNVICGGVMMVSAAAVLCSGRSKSMVPVMIAGVLAFVIVVAISPGEFKSISKADENLRDKLATSTVSIQGNEKASSESKNNKENRQGKGSAKKNRQADNEKKYMKIWIVLGLILLTAMILFIPAVIHDRLEKKRKKNRKDLDSQDPGQAIRAMFPYAVKWLQAAGLGSANIPFADYQQSVKEMTSDEYSDEYSLMLERWKEAAYSDHVFNEEDRAGMKLFMDRTIADVKSRMGMRDKLKVRFVTAL